ncbi:unnamed protein product [Rotaria sp. Silwood1]|nr:unnamed protein product [Rotaria sp. Silwood1]CAF3387539.1 unnamed protein product [Rotaria sp. Silwood1]CAF4907957.1 unnamed protein product [Rotaria sp. Silwood1]CAF4938598.1 unnamed protein product [Rotaria sp. Silwood1]
MACMLDHFPMEVLHMIFDYLKPNDLLHGFVEINSYIDTILHSYSRIRLNCKSMKKSTFYYICEHIYPNQIQSLVLADDEYTPGQIKLFMSLLPLIQFINLQSINIIQIDDVNLLCLILSHLENHPQIQSLIIYNYHMEISKKYSRCITETLSSLPSLKYLTFMKSSTLTTLKQPLLKLTHLTIRSCRFIDLKIIFHWVPNLLYLKILVPYNAGTFTFDYIPSNLSSLMIESQDWILFDAIENFLSFTKSLKRFIFETSGELALLDGRRWETLIKTKLPHLTEFALNITPEENNMTGDDVLIPFQNSFWTNEKHWHMACLISTSTQSCARLFSVPHFSPTDAWYPSGEGFINYSITPYSFDDKCTQLRVWDCPSPVLVSSPFKHVQTLSLECNIDNIDQLTKFMNLLSVHHLILRSSIQSTSLNGILQAASNIDQLTIYCKTLMQIIDSFSDAQNKYEQIKRLYVQDIVLSNDIDQICQTFPKLEYISLHVRERNDSFRVFNGLYELTSATIRWTQPFKTHLSIMDKYLQENNICTDGTYGIHASSLCVWID